MCLFDIDGTLIHANGAGQKAFLETAEIIFEQKPPSLDFSGVTDAGVIKEVFIHFKKDLTYELLGKFRQTYFSLLDKYLAIPKYAPEVLPGVKSLLKALRQRGDKVGLLTGNSVEGARKKLKICQLDTYFSFGVYGDKATCRNELARGAFDVLEKQLGQVMEAKNRVIIGDTLRDIACAKAIETVILAVATGSYSMQQLGEANWVVQDLSNTEQILEIFDSIAR